MTPRLSPLLLAALAACGSSRPPSAAPAADPTPAFASPARPTPEIGAWGFDLEGMDRTVAPGTDFFRYTNGRWLASTPIPADRAMYANFIAVADRAEARTRQIIETAAGPPGSEGQKIADLYQAFMDEAAIEAQGTAPIQAELDRIAQIKDVSGVVRQLAANARRSVATPIERTVDQDSRDPEHYIANIGQGGLGLPDRDMYDVKAAQFAAVRAGYRKYIATLFTLVGGKDAERRAAAVYALEDKIAATHWTLVETRDALKTYNKRTIAELAKLAPDLDWKLWLDATGLAGQTAVDVLEPSAIAAAARLIRRQPLAVWRDYLTLRTLDAAAPYLGKAFVDARFEMYGKTLGGTPEPRPRWKRGVEQVTSALGEAVGKLYVARYFTPQTKARADQLVGNLLAAMGQRLDALVWMGPETKARAKAKLATYNPKIGYPKRWRDYGALTVVPGDAYGNAMRANAFEDDRQLAKLGQPLDRDEWGMPPMMVDAYYNASLNEIVFPAGILQAPFFDAAADDAVNYGSIGAVIGHEISHGFDDQGAQFDAKGVLANWWTPADAEKFHAATQKLVAQYSAYCPVPAAAGKPALCVNGELTIGENIADLAGLTVAYDAYKLSLGGKLAPVLDGFTGDQRFFLGFAQAWRGMFRDAELANRLATDPHSPVGLRAQTVRNLDAWYDAFRPKPSDALYLAPDQRVKIW